MTVGVPWARDTPAPSYRDRRVLVTGATGFVGHHLVGALQRQGARLALLTQRPPQGMADAVVLVGDIRDAEWLQSRVADWQPEVVFHLAATRARQLTSQAFAQAVNVNIEGTLNLFDAVRGSQCLRRIVLVGSAEEYGRGQAPFAESAREAPVNAYSFSKVAATHLAQVFASQLQMPTVVLRPTVVYGPGQQEDMFIPGLIRSLLHGADFAMTQGQQTRDFLHVQDLVGAMLLAGTAACAPGAVINVGAGRAVPINAVVAIVERLLQSSGRVLRGTLPYRPGEIMDYAVDIGRARDLLGWLPAVSLEEGLRQTIDWYARN